MDLAGILLTALASAVLKLIVDDVASQPRFAQLRQWLRGDAARRVVEAALAHTIWKAAVADSMSGSPILDWTFIAAQDAVGLLARLTGAHASPEAVIASLAAAWGRRSAGLALDRQKLLGLAQRFVDEYRDGLRQDRVFSAGLIDGDLEKALQAVLRQRVSVPEDGATRPSPEVKAALLDTIRLWGNAPLWIIDEPIALEAPLAIRVDLNTLRGFAQPLRVYPGERAIVLRDGGVVGSLGPGPLDPGKYEKGGVLTRRRGRLEAVVYLETLLDLEFSVDARTKGQEWVRLECVVRLQVENADRIQAGLMHRKVVLMLADLRARIYSSVKATLERFVYERDRAQLVASPTADDLEMAVQLELERGVHRLADSGLAYLGVPSWSVTDLRNEQPSRRKAAGELEISLLQTEVEILERKIPLLERLQALGTRKEELESRPAAKSRERERQGSVSQEAPECLWRFPAVGSASAIGPVRGGVAFDEHRVYVADARGGVYCLDLDTGKEVPGWQADPLPDKVKAGLILSQIHADRPPQLLVPCCDGNLYYLDSTTGAKGHVAPVAPSVDAEAGCPESTPLISGGRIFMSCTVRTNWGGVVALRLGDGAPSGAWTGERRGVKSPPAIVGRYLLFATVDSGGQTIFRADTWQSSYVERFGSTRGRVMGSPLVDVARGRQYVIGEDGDLHVMDLSGHEEPWSPYELGAAVQGTGLIGGNRLYVGDERGCLHALDLGNSCETVWEFHAQGAIRTTPVLYNGLVFFGSLGGYVYAVDAEKGELFGSFPTKKAVHGSLVITPAGRVVVGCEDAMSGCIYALNWHMNLWSKAAPWCESRGLVEQAAKYYEEAGRASLDPAMREQYYALAVGLWRCSQSPEQAARLREGSAALAGQVADEYEWSGRAWSGRDRPRAASYFLAGADFYEEAGNAEKARDCRMAAARLAPLPRLSIRPVNTPPFEEGEPGQITFDLCNYGDAPAYEVWGRLAGQLAEEVRFELKEPIPPRRFVAVVAEGITPQGSGLLIEVHYQDAKGIALRTHRRLELEMRPGARIVVDQDVGALTLRGAKGSTGPSVRIKGSAGLLKIDMED